MGPQESDMQKPHKQLWKELKTGGEETWVQTPHCRHLKVQRVQHEKWTRCSLLWHLSRTLGSQGFFLIELWLLSTLCLVSVLG